MSSLDVLQHYLAEGYCLHGSKSKLHRIEPRHAHCETGRPEGCLRAVYAEPLDVRVPIVMALFSGHGTSRYNGNGTVLTVTGDRTFSPGYVHVLSPDTFEDVDGEFVSFQPVTPVSIVPVNPSILWELLGLGNFDLQISIPHPW